MFKNKTENSYKKVSGRVVCYVGLVAMSLLGLTLPSAVEV